MPKFSAQDYNFVAKRLRENFPQWINARSDEWPSDLEKQKTTLMDQRAILTALALDFALSYLKDNPSFDPLAFLDACSPDVDLFPLSELWKDD